MHHWYINVREPWFSLIKSGKKTVEGRLNHALFKNISVGDKITWKCGSAQHDSIVSAINKYSSFKDMIETEGLANVLPGIATVADGINIYRQFYSEDKEKMFGVLALIQLDKTQQG